MMVMLNTSIITMLILITPIVIPLIIIGIVKSCDTRKRPYNYSNYNYPPHNGYCGYPQPPYPARPMPQPPKPQKKQHDMTVSNVLFLIGTAFVVLSGLAFGVAKWVHTSHAGRVAIIMAASAVSFILSGVVGGLLPGKVRLDYVLEMLSGGCDKQHSGTGALQRKSTIKVHDPVLLSFLAGETKKIQIG